MPLQGIENNPFTSCLASLAATYEERLRQGKLLDEVALHAGDVQGNDKMLTLQRLDLWMPEAWRPKDGLAILSQVRISLHEGRMSMKSCMTFSAVPQEHTDAVSL